MSIKISDSFLPLYTNDTRYFVVTGGRGSGKSYSVNLFLTHLTFEAGHRILFTRYTMSSAKISIIPEFQEKIEVLGVGNYFNIEQSEIVNNGNGSAVIFRGIKTSSGIQTAALKSLQGITTWVVDEAEELVDEATFDKIDLSIRQKGIQNRVILILNPTTKEHWIYKRFFESRGINDGYNGIHIDTTYIHTTYLDNIDNLDHSFIQQVQKLQETNPIKYKHIILGGWLDKAEGVIFTTWEHGQFDNSLPFVYGLDFGFSVDPTALTKVAINEKTKTIYIKEIIYRPMLTTDMLADLMKECGRNLIIADSAEPRLIFELTRKGFNIKAVKKYPNSVLEGIRQMQNYKLVIEGENIAKELNNYRWHDAKSETPIDAYNHSIDSTRYAIIELRSKSAIFAPKGVGSKFDV